MKQRLLFAYQVVTGLSDSTTGLLLIAAPGLTLHLMHLQAPYGALTYLSYIGAFVFSVGLACLYGALLITRPHFTAKLETVWLLTAITRSIVALFVISKIATGMLATGWIIVAISDGALALLQIAGLSLGWASDEAK